mgnify:CR=1 FL=1
MLTASAAPAPAVDELVEGRFRLLTLLGDDAAGALYHALDEVTAEVVRMRIPVGAVDERLLGVQHPSLARHNGVTPVARHVITEDIDGQPLALEAVGTALQRTHAVARQLLPLFAELHAHDVVHGHLGLHSVWRDREGHLRVVDLGLPSRLDESSLPFASPERRRGEVQDARGDVYSLASILFGVASGSPPQTQALQPVAPHCTALPDAVAEVIWQAMDPRQSFRYADARALWDALEPVLLDALDAEDAPLPDEEAEATLDELTFDEDGESTLDHPRAASLAPSRPRRHRPRARASTASMAAAAAILLGSIGVASVLFTGLGVFVWTVVS